jgi:pterin-4a-carbinolamine dehydratase
MSSNSHEAQMSVHSKSRRPEELRRPPATVERLRAERVQERMKMLPEWRLTHGGSVVSRVFDFPDPRVATSYAAFVSDFASALKVPVSIALSGGRITLRLQGFTRKGCSGGLTEAALDFAEILG